MRPLLVLAVAVLALVGCSPAEPQAEPTRDINTDWSTTTPTPPASTQEAAPGFPLGVVATGACADAAPQLVTALEASLDGTLDAAQMISGDDGIYVGGHVMDGTTRVSSADVWYYPTAGPTIYALSGGARDLSTWPDGRDLGLSAGSTTGIAVIDCVTAAD